MDDMIITGDVSLLKRTVHDLKKVLNVKVQYNIKDFLHCDIIELHGEIHMYQRVILSKIIIE
jgi:hypothetical protein